MPCISITAAEQKPLSCGGKIIRAAQMVTLPTNSFRKKKGAKEAQTLTLCDHSRANDNGANLRSYFTKNDRLIGYLFPICLLPYC